MQAIMAAAGRRSLAPLVGGRGILVGLLLLCLGAGAHALPPAVEADRLAMKAKAALDARDYATADAALAQLSGLGVPLPEQVDYLRGIAANGIGKYARARKYLGAYLEKTGTRGKYYAQALAAYTEADDKLNRLQAEHDATVARYQEDKARIADELQDCLRTYREWADEYHDLQIAGRYDEADELAKNGTYTERQCRQQYQDDRPQEPDPMPDLD